MERVAEITDHLRNKLLIGFNLVQSHMMHGLVHMEKSHVPWRELFQTKHCVTKQHAEVLTMATDTQNWRGNQHYADKRFPRNFFFLFAI